MEVLKFEVDKIVNSNIIRSMMKIDKDMDMLLEEMEVHFENGCGIIESLKLCDVDKKDWKKILELYKKWEVKELEYSEEWDREEMLKEDVEFLEKNKIKWNWME